MDISAILLLTALIFAAAALYASVGHAGASGYLAAMALFGLAPLEMKPAALSLNILVASIATYTYLRAGRFSWQLFWPFALASVPFAYVGGLIMLPGEYYKPVVGLVLVYAAWRFVLDAAKPDYALRKASLWVILLVGAGLGFLSGLVGVGGGIFLSPLLIALRWESVKNISGIAAAFILVNSIAGLAGFMSSQTPQLPDGIVYWALAAALGGYIGAQYGSKRFATPMLKRLLALVLVIAGVKLMAAV